METLISYVALHPGQSLLVTYVLGGLFQLTYLLVTNHSEAYSAFINLKRMQEAGARWDESFYYGVNSGTAQGFSCKAFNLKFSKKQFFFQSLLVALFWGWFFFLYPGWPKKHIEKNI